MELEIDEKDRLFRQEALLLHVMQQVHEISLKKRWSRKRLAKKVGVSVKQLSLFMGGEHEPRLRDVADLFWALGKKVELKVSDLAGKPIKATRCGECGGSGLRPHSEVVCPKCDGWGLVKK